MIDLQSPGSIATFQDSIESTFDSSWAKDLAFVNNESDRATETYKWVGHIPGMRAWVGSRISQGFTGYEYTITNFWFEQTVRIDDDTLRRDKVGLVNRALGELGQSSTYDWEDKVSTLMLTNGTCYDNTAYFGTGHKYNPESTAQKNLVTSTEITELNVVDPTKPTTTEMSEIIPRLITYPMTWVNDQGQPLNGSARSYQFHVGTLNLFSAVTNALGVTILAGGAQSTMTAWKNFNVSVVFNTRLAADTDSLYVFRTDSPTQKPFILQEEVGLKYETLGEGSDHYFNTREHILSVSTSRNAGYGPWYYALRADLSYWDLTNY